MNANESRCVEINMTRFPHMIWESLYEIEKISFVIRGVFVVIGILRFNRDIKIVDAQINQSGTIERILIPVVASRITIEVRISQYQRMDVL